MNRDFAADRKLCDAATNDAWPGVTEEKVEVKGNVATLYSFGVWSQRDIEFIFAAREGWPAALDEIDRLKTDYDQAISDMETWMQAAKEAQAQNAVLRWALECDCASNCEGNWEECDHPDCHIHTGLRTTSVDALERVQGLVDGLREIRDEYPAARGCAKRWLAKWEGK